VCKKLKSSSGKCLNRSPKAFVLHDPTATTRVTSTRTMTWKQVMNYRGLCPPQVLYAWGPFRGLRHQLLLGNRETNSIFRFYSLFSRIKLILSNDVEKNPGPTIGIRSYNIRGLAEYTKLKRMLNVVPAWPLKDEPPQLWIALPKLESSSQS